jgi:CHAT domain-containing protein
MGLSTDDSYLLLGGEKNGGSGYRLRLSDIETLNGLTFDATALLSLSACETAMSQGGSDGKEVDSLAAIGRQRGAQSVLATLWDVNDASTGQLMADFYTRWTTGAGMPKSEALRQAQLAMLHPSVAANGGTANVSGRGAKSTNAKPGQEDSSGTAPTFSHPYFWAPFILMGNWQ